MDFNDYIYFITLQVSYPKNIVLNIYKVKYE